MWGYQNSQHLYEPCWQTLDDDAMAITFHTLHSSTSTTEVLAEIKSRFSDHKSTCVQAVTDFTPHCELAVLEESARGWPPKCGQRLISFLPLPEPEDSDAVHEAVSNTLGTGGCP